MTARTSKARRLAASALLLAGVAGCGSVPGTAAPAGSPSQPSPAPKAALAPVNAGFFETFAASYAGADEAERFVSFEAGVQASTAVVLADVIGSGHSRTIGDVDSGGGLDLVAVTLDVRRVLSGSIPEEHRDRLTVEFIARRAPAGRPGGPSIWFLRNKLDLPPARKPGAPSLPPTEGDYYRLISSDGIFVQGQQRVENPLREKSIAPDAGQGQSRAREPGAVSRRAEGFRTIDQLAEAVEAVPR